MSQLTSYIVEDLLPSAEMLRVVFLLESPYVNEVIHGHPLAGKSGKTVASWLLGNIEEFSGWSESVPIGCQLKEWLVGWSRVGLMNCSQRPMDESVYGCLLEPADREMVAHLDLIRTGSRTEIRASPGATALEAELARDLSSRLVGLPDSTLIVPCGDIARRMLRMAARSYSIGGSVRYSGRVPHPSRRSWIAPRHQLAMERLKDVLDARFAEELGVPNGE